MENLTNPSQPKSKSSYADWLRENSPFQTANPPDKRTTKHILVLDRKYEHDLLLNVKENFKSVINPSKINPEVCVSEVYLLFKRLSRVPHYNP